MPILTPSKRWQPAYHPLKDRRFPDSLEEAFERSLKGLLWGCRMCGNCLLQETAFICPMACPKGLRNGPCGGSTPEHCCVVESRPCIWYEIYSRAETMGRLEKLLEILPPLDWEKTGTSAIKDVRQKVFTNGITKSIKTLIESKPGERTQKWEHFFRAIRQPDWWNGNDLPNSASCHEPVTSLERILLNGEFAITCEWVPPLCGDISQIDAELIGLGSHVDAVNITDNPSANPHVSSLTCAVRAKELGVEPILQMAARDRTRLSFQTDLLGASASGIHNLLLISGDHPNKGLPPFSRMDIWDYDSVQAIWIARKLRDKGKLLDGRNLSRPPVYHIGAAASPCASKPKYEAIRTEKKMNAGAQFFQTNLIFDITIFTEYLNALEQRNLLNRIHLIAGVAPIRSLRAAKFLSKLPGIHIPDEVMHRLATSKDVKREGYQLCLELISNIKTFPGVQGIHFMALRDFSDLKKLISETDLKKSIPQ
jgi:methylenetetrahydrofolate reductase (NADPH)